MKPSLPTQLSSVVTGLQWPGAHGTCPFLGSRPPSLMHVVLGGGKGHVS